MDATHKSGGGGVSAIVEYDYTAKESDELDLVKGAIICNIKQMPGGWWEGTLQASGKTGMFPDNFVRVIDPNDESSVVLRDKTATVNRRCKAVYSYTQVNDDELTLAVGDVIEFLGEVEEGWWRGRLKNKVGVFPSNFVISIENSPIMASKRPAPIGAADPTTTTVKGNLPTATAAATATTSAKKLNRFGYNQNSNTTTSTAATASTAVPDLVSGGEVSATVPVPSLPPKPLREYCRVEFPYAPVNDDELELKVGDIIAIISTELPDKGWWKGEINGKVGVFPDNFVKLIAPNEVASSTETQQQQAQSNTISAASHTHNKTTATTAKQSSISSNVPAMSGSAAAPVTKVFIKKSSNNTTTTTTTTSRKDSFGSRDSLNDILSETGLQTGNVAAQRKSLENKNLDLTNAPDASSRIALKKSATTTTTNQSSIMSTTTSSTSSSSDTRRSMENLDEKTPTATKTTPPPVLTKKPTVPSKKTTTTTTVTSVAGNLLSGLKQKVKNVENKLTTAASHDHADGVGSSRLAGGHGLPDDSPTRGQVVMRRAATIAVEDSDFDRVERTSMLPDMRASRVKAPKRRPPSAAINIMGESNNNNSIYLNGSSGSGGSGSMGGGGSSSSTEILNVDDSKPQSSDDNSTGEEQLAKPKQLEFKKAPWMEELKVSQLKKKTSPSVELRSGGGGGGAGNNMGSSVAERTSKLFGEEVKITSATGQAASGAPSTTSNQTTTTKVQSTVITSSVMQQSLNLEKKELSTISSSSGNGPDSMAKSISGRLGGGNAGVVGTPESSDEGRAARPNTLSLRNRSDSPSTAQVARGGLKSAASPASSTSSTTNNNATHEMATSSGHQYTQHSNSVSNNSAAAKTASLSTSTTAIVNNHHHSSHTHQHAAHSTTANDSARVVELEKRVEKLESVVQAQQRAIEELVRTLREETDRVKTLRGELDKYAQCVTQV